MEKFLNQLYHIYSLIITFGTFIFGEHWLLFVIYLILNIIDGITGWIKARINHTESSQVGFIGIVKKIGYWLTLFIAFLVSVGFDEIGSIIGIDLSIMILLGWYVLASLIINECRSILENLVEIGCDVPYVFIKGLQIVSNKIDVGGEEDE